VSVRPTGAKPSFSEGTDDQVQLGTGTDHRGRRHSQGRPRCRRLDGHGRLLRQCQTATTQRGCRTLHEWALGLAPEVRYGVEGTDSYGAGLARFLAAEGASVTEIRGPNRKLRRDRGKSDTIDAEAAARAVLAGTSRVVPKAGNDWVEQLRMLRLAAVPPSRPGRRPSTRCTPWSWGRPLSSTTPSCSCHGLS
jgi:hypothetical protein